MTNKRLFFGLDATSQRTPLTRLQHALALDAKPVAPENLHLTLLFLGLVAEERLEALYQLGHAVAWHHAPLSITLDKLGLFHHAQVAWMGATQPPTGLLALEHALRSGVTALGLSLEARPYRPHVSLYRKARVLPALTPPHITLEAQALHLYESCSNPEGVRYLKLASWPLG